MQTNNGDQQMFTHNIIKDFFTFRGRSGRVEFFIFAAVYLGINIATSIALWINLGLGFDAFFQSEPVSFNVDSVSLVILYLAVIILFLIGITAVSTRRVRDTGLNPWFVLVNWIPDVNIAFSIFLLFAPTDVVKKKPNNGPEWDDSMSRFRHNLVKNIFTFTGRSGRVEYFIFSSIYMICMVLLLIFGGVAIFFSLKGPEYASFILESLSLFVFGIFLLLLSLPFAVALWAISTRRVRDTKLNPWFVLVGFISGINVALSIFLLFAPQDTAKKLTNSEPKSSDLESAEVNPTDSHT